MVAGRCNGHHSGRQPKTYVKPEAAITVFELLMMGGVSPETCWAIKKHWNNKFYYTVAFCWFFLEGSSCYQKTWVRILWLSSVNITPSLLFSNTPWSVLSQYYVHTSDRLSGRRRFWTSAMDTPSLNKATVRINNIFAWFSWALLPQEN